MIAQRQVHPSREHEHRKPHLTQEEGGWVCGVYCAQAGPPDDDPGDDLTDHRGHEPPSAEPEQRAAETGEHDHDEGSETHGGAAYALAWRRLRSRRDLDACLTGIWLGSPASCSAKGGPRSVPI